MYSLQGKMRSEERTPTTYSLLDKVVAKQYVNYTCVQSHRKWRLATRHSLLCDSEYLLWVYFKFGRPWMVLDPRAWQASVLYQQNGEYLKCVWVIIVERSKAERRKKQESEKWHFHDRTLLRLAVHESCWSQGHSKRTSGRLNNFLTYLWWSYTVFAYYI